METAKSKNHFTKLSEKQTKPKVKRKIERAKHKGTEQNMSATENKA